jgi:ATP-binding cassette subfamily C protein CydD
LRADVGVACSIAAMLTWFAAIVILSAVIDDVFLGGADAADVGPRVVVLLGLIAMRAVLGGTGEWAGETAAASLVRTVRGRLVAALFRLGPVEVRGERSGDLVRLAGDGVKSVGPWLSRFRSARILAFVVPAIVVIAVLVLDPWSVLILVVTGPVLILLLSLIGRRVRDASARREDELAWTSAHFLDVLRGLPTLKMFGRADEHATVIEAVGRRNAETTMDVLRTAFQTTLVLEWGATAATALVAIEVSVRLMGGEVAFAPALAVLLLTPEFFAPLRRLSAEYHTGPAGVAAAARIYDVLDRPAPAATVAITPAPERAPIRFDDVSVAYDDGARPALRGLTLDIPAVGSIALVGPTGAGKSTVADLLLRFVVPDAGEVTVGGIDLRTIDPAAWRSRIAWVGQRPSLFAGTIAANLRLGRPDARETDLWEALAAAASDGFVRTLPEGLETQVGEGGVRLSGGERQRLALARAFLRDAPLLILDEATSHLDEETQEHVLATVRDLARDRALVLIAHRPEIARIADVVVTMDAGRATRVGTAEVAR